MVRISVQATPDTDIEVAVGDIERKCAEAGLAPRSIHQVSTEARTTLAQLVEQGRRLASMGSHLRVQREIRDDGFCVVIRFATAGQRGRISRLVDRLLGR